MSVPAFYAPPAAWKDGIIRLDAEEARHLRVLRLTPGDEARAMNGEGRAAQCRILRAERRSAELEVISEEYAPAPASRAIMALALSKATRRGFFMEKAVELDAAGVWIWRGENSQGRIPADFAAGMRKSFIAGMKQCGNPWLPDARTFESLEALLREAPCADWRIAPLEREAGKATPREALFGRPGLTIYLIGPEGGYSDGEIASLLKTDFDAISLGSRVLRCETAAALCLGLHYWAAQASGK